MIARLQSALIKKAQEATDSAATLLGEAAIFPPESLGYQRRMLGVAVYELKANVWLALAGVDPEEWHSEQSKQE